MELKIFTCCVYNLTLICGGACVFHCDLGLNWWFSEVPAKLIAYFLSSPFVVTSTLPPLYSLTGSVSVYVPLFPAEAAEIQVHDVHGWAADRWVSLCRGKRSQIASV